MPVILWERAEVAKAAEKEKVLVAMSGGVDSSVAALHLKEAGYSVVGVTMRLWVDPFSEEQAGSEARGCCSLDAVEDARRIAAVLNIPHYVLNMQEEFYDTVVRGFTAEYLRGRTPNPCVECNRFIKFSHLLQKAKGLGINYIATGHYARIKYDPAGSRYRLLKGCDRQKDQSYMLYVLKQDELASTLFPLGDKTKEQVREIAQKHGFKVAAKAESQEICFIPDNDYRSFMERRCPEALQPGDVVSTDGQKLGRHRGIAFYTIGQRKGLGLTTREPYYVVRMEPEKNRVVVGPVNEAFSSGLLAERLNFIANVPIGPQPVEVKIRYRAPAVQAMLYPPQNDRVRIIFKKKQKAITPGQSAVFYCGDEVLGGGTIAAAIS